MDVVRPTETLALAQLSEWAMLAKANTPGLGPAPSLRLAQGSQAC